MNKIIKMFQIVSYVSIKPLLLLTGTRFLTSEIQKRKVIIAANHISMLDFLLVQGVIKLRQYLSTPPLFTMTANKYIDMPLGGLLLRLNGGFPAKEHKHYKYGVQKSKDELEKNGSVIIFPEGGLPISGIPRGPKEGVVIISNATHTPVLPVYIHKKKSRFIPSFIVTSGSIIEADEVSLQRIMDEIYALKDDAKKQ